MSNKVFTVGQLPEAVDWLFRCGKLGKFSLTLNSKRHWSEFDESDIHTALEKEMAETYIRAAVNLNVSRYGHKEEDINIVIHEPSLDELIADF